MSPSVFQLSTFSSSALSTPLFRLVAFFGSFFYSFIQISCVLQINIFQFRSFYVLHCKSLFLFFEFVFFRSYFPDRAFFFLRICFLSSSIIFIFILVLQILLESKKLELHVDKFLHLNSKTQVFKARFCHWTRVLKTWDASFLTGFKTLLTNNILSPHYASLQISPPLGQLLINKIKKVWIHLLWEI